MVGLVLVSHSKALVKSLVDLIHQISLQEIPLATAAGVGPEHQEFGTDAIELLESIEKVYSDDGVLVLMDLGSAVLSAKMALELLDPEKQAKVKLCSAPFVEGAIGAAVQIGLGSDLDTVFQEAEQSLFPKREQFGETEGEEGQAVLETHEESNAPKKEISLTLNNLHGLHARPAARFVQTAAGFDASVQVQNVTTGKGPVSARSLNALATLGALKGHQIKVVAQGSDADEALSALEKLVQDNFGEEEIEPVPKIKTTPTLELGMNGAVQCTPIAEGIALGPLYNFRVPPPVVSKHKIENPEAAWDRFQQAVLKVKQDIKNRRKDIAANVGEEQASIFDAHLLILEDPELLEQTRMGIFQDHKNEALAWDDSIQEVIKNYKGLDDPYLQQRAMDVRDVGNQVLNAISGEIQQRIILEKPVILAAMDLTPTQTALLDLDKVHGLVTVAGGPTSHTAILSRSLGIPAVAGVPEKVLTLPDDTPLAIDGSSGALWISPSDKTKSKLSEMRAKWLDNHEQLIQSSHKPAITQDGYQVEVVANVGNVQDASLAVKNGAEGVGLLRTEFLFLTRNTPPDEAEQFDALKQIAEVMGKRPVIVRTLDVGGDKNLPYIDLPHEANPFLGVRAVRLSFQNPDIFRTQLRAILRAGDGHNFHIMFPMIANVGEVLRAKEMLEEEHQTLDRDGISHAWPVKTGIMVEIPSAALLSPIFAPHVDFFSVGTNDLTQYTLAAERGNPNLKDMADALHPAVLQLISKVVKAAEEHGKWVGVCGELAGDPLAAPILVGLGVKELSLNPAGIPKVKDTLRTIKFTQAKQVATQVLQAESSQEARKLAKEFADSLG